MNKGSVGVIATNSSEFGSAIPCFISLKDCLPFSNVSFFMSKSSGAFKNLANCLSTSGRIVSVLSSELSDEPSKLVSKKMNSI